MLPGTRALRPWLEAGRPFGPDGNGQRRPTPSPFLKEGEPETATADGERRPTPSLFLKEEVTETASYPRRFAATLSYRKGNGSEGFAGNGEGL